MILAVFKRNIVSETFKNIPKCSESLANQSLDQDIMFIGLWFGANNAFLGNLVNNMTFVVENHGLNDENNQMIDGTFLRPSECFVKFLKE